MGLVKRGNFLYLQAKKGYFHEYDKATKTNTQHKGYEGTLVGLRTKTQPIAGTDVLQIEVRMKDVDSDQVAVITWSAESYLTLTFFQRLADLNLEKPFIFNVWPGKDSGKKGNIPTYASIIQDGKTIGVFEKGKDPYPDYPQPEYTQKRSGGTQANWDAVIDRVEKQIEDFKQSHGNSVEQEKVEKPSSNYTEKEDGDDEQIPF